MPVLSPYKIGLVDVIVDLLRTCLQSSILITSGLYKIKEEGSIHEATGLSVEEFCRKHALFASEETVSSCFL